MLSMLLTKNQILETINHSNMAAKGNFKNAYFTHE